MKGCSLLKAKKLNKLDGTNHGNQMKYENIRSEYDAKNRSEHTLKTYSPNIAIIYVTFLQPILKPAINPVLNSDTHCTPRK